MAASGKAVHLTETEVEQIRKALVARRKPGTYAPGMWAVSHLNREPAILAASLPSAYPKSVILRDITLRTIEQKPGVAVTTEQRRRLAEALVDVGICAVEVSIHGTGRNQQDLGDEVRYLKQLKPDLEIKIGGTMTDEMLAQSANLGVTHAEIWFPALPAITPIYWNECYRRAWNGEDWRLLDVPLTVDDQIERASVFVERARRFGLRPGAGLNMLTLADEEHIERFAKGMNDAGMTDIWLSDGSAGLGPEALAYVVQRVRHFAPACRVGAYVRNSFGLAVAGVLACVHAGASIVDVSLNGLSAATGQADLAVVSAALEMLYGVDTGIDLSKLTSVARLASDISGVPLDRNHPITGAEATDWDGSEVITQELKVDPLLHWPFEPAIVGGEKKWEISPQSGMWSISDKLEQLGVVVDRSLVPAVREAFMDEIRLRRRVLSDFELLEVTNRVLRTARRPV